MRLDGLTQVQRGTIVCKTTEGKTVVCYANVNAARRMRAWQTCEQGTSWHQTHTGTIGMQQLMRVQLGKLLVVHTHQVCMFMCSVL